MRKLSDFARREAVFCVSLLLALGSMALTPPSAAYWGYIDFDVLEMLFCLMGVVAGLKALGLFDRAADALMRRAGSLRALALTLTGLCFFSSMLVTNDVALLTFVPFTLGVLAGCPNEAITVIVLETVAANLGSMATPIGNPQNLYLYAKYDLSAGEFFAAMAPLTLLSGALLALCCLVLPKRALPPVPKRETARASKPLTALYLALLALCLSAVFKAVPKLVCFGAVLACLLVFDRKALANIDYLLLATFVCFFVFVGNLAALEPVKASLAAWIGGRELLAGAAASQVVSNVPAALMLSPFTEAWRPLLQGVNLGGLGTLIASLASLISFKLYAKSEGARTGAYLTRFTLVNVVFLAMLLGAAALLG